MEDVQAVISSVVATVERYLLDDLKNAESCETKGDLCANLRNALTAARCVESDLVRLLKRADKC
jgi:hypothetical protein